MAGALSDKPTAAGLTAEIDRPLHTFGFEYSSFSKEKVTGRFTVNESCCRAFKRLHFGVVALVAEAVASAGAYVACGFQRIAGVQLSVNCIRPAFLGDQIEVEARLIPLDRTIQVWEVQQWKVNPSGSGEKVLLSTSMVTMQCYLPLLSGMNMKSFEETAKKFAKL
ncbi:hypothetical protein HPP92_021596 [Vanilla planifolia]|uniref:Thioesterase domain-containing protein n=1 Tax=Vanilla planifolia TaxID=51239 RepID=A0A835UJK7_VANPL|nr:hypothetical protein HPP92_021596 [Vanilla planifolia]